nr:hypothetical protein [uncultured Desulfobulbus sp.]
MSNIFLYGAHSSNALIRLELALEGISRELSLTRLPPGPLFSSTTSLKMRSNDILLLYAQNEADIEWFIQQRHNFDGFRLILILQKRSSITTNRFILLSPRLVADEETSLFTVTDYCLNICRKEKLLA